ncbi:MAG: AAA family ATPase [Alphaproteobacteria bacterium]|nr:AAA family ATPase [Alphaproteobacteria bacterium]
MPLKTLDYNDPDLPSRDEIKAAMLARLPEVLRYLFPNGRQLKREFQIGSLQGEKGQSLKVSMSGDKAGLWQDFESGHGGDIFDLWAAVQGLDTQRDFPTVLRSCADWLGLAVVVPPVSFERREWIYTDVSGKPLVTVKRTDGADGRKSFLPYDNIAGKHAMPESRLLYNLPGVAASDRIIITEGEKCAQVLIDLGIPATTVMGGANFDPAKTDFSPLAGKDIIIWPDNDKAGQKYVERLKSGLQSIKPRSLRVIIPPADKPEKWDAADAVQDGLNIQGFLNSVLQSKIQLQRYEAFSLAELIADKSPMPDDLIAPRLLTPSGMLVIGGAPKSGKSDFTLSLLTHMAAGQPFLKFTPPRPLRVFVLQAEIQYDYLRERLQKMGLSEEAILKAGKNIHITPQLKLLLNDDGLEIIKDLIHEKFPDAPPDIIVIDPIRNVFDGGPDFGNLGENDNNAMLFFLQQRVEMLRDMINPRAGIILVHHTKKISKAMFKDDPFQALSGASSLRSYYTSGMLIFRPDEAEDIRSLHFELRNGPGIVNMHVIKRAGQWGEIDPDTQPLIRQDYSNKLKSERHRQHDQILQRLLEDAQFDQKLYTIESFSEAYEDIDGLGSQTTIKKRISVLMGKGYIKCLKTPHPLTKQTAERSKYGYLVVENMQLGQDEIDEATGEIMTSAIAVLPTHYKDEGSGGVRQVENAHSWVYHDEEKAR